MSHYRFSISWSRVIPNGVGEPNPLGIAYYKKLIAALKQANIEPMVYILLIKFTNYKVFNINLINHILGDYLSLGSSANIRQPGWLVKFFHR